jgi:hypothetical protein
LSNALLIPFLKVVEMCIISASHSLSEQMVDKAETILETLGMDIKWHIIKPENPVEIKEVTPEKYNIMKDVNFLIKIPFEDDASNSHIDFLDHCIAIITIPKELLERLFDVRFINSNGVGPYAYIYPFNGKNDVNTSDDGITFIELINKCIGHRYTPVAPVPGIFYSQIYEINTDTNIVQLTPHI